MFATFYKTRIMYNTFNKNIIVKLIALLKWRNEMSTSNLQPQNTGSILSQLIGKNGACLDDSGFSYAKQNGVFPILHLGAIIDNKRTNLLNAKYNKIKSQKSVEFVASSLDKWWNNSKIIPEKHLFYKVVHELKQELNIRGFGEELESNVKLEVYDIIRYFELSGVYDKKFFDKIWQDSPAEVQTKTYHPQS